MPETAHVLTPRKRILATAAALGLSVSAEFIPFSQSRNAAPQPDGKIWRSLNWRVTLKKTWPSSYPNPPVTDVLATDYSAGAGHAPAYKLARGGVERDHMIAWECEHGRPAGGARFNHSAGPNGRGAWEGFLRSGGKPLLPDFADVLASLASDSSVLDAGGFENWAADLGYDTDSRKAEATYRACLDIALKLRAGIGDAGLQALRDAAAEY